MLPQSIVARPELPETLPHHIRQVELVMREAHRFDVIHFHLDYVHFPIVRLTPVPHDHDFARSRMHPHDHQALFDAYPEGCALVSISDDQRRPVPSANWRATVHYGLPRDPHIPRGAEERTSRSSAVCRLKRGWMWQSRDRLREAGMPLKVAAKIYPEEVCYFEEVIRTTGFRVSSPWVEFVGGSRGGRALKMNSWAMPTLSYSRSTGPSHSGLVMIEAMACWYSPWSRSAGDRFRR